MAKQIHPSNPPLENGMLGTESQAQEQGYKRADQSADGGIHSAAAEEASKWTACDVLPDPVLRQAWSPRKEAQ